MLPNLKPSIQYQTEHGYVKLLVRNKFYNTNMEAPWYIKLYITAEVYRSFGATHCLHLHGGSETSCLTTRLHGVTSQTAGNCTLPGLNVTSFHIQNQLHISGNNGSLHEADHKNIKSKYLQLQWRLEVSNLKHVELHNIHYVCNTQLPEKWFIKFIKIVYFHNAWSLNNCRCVLNTL